MALFLESNPAKDCGTHMCGGPDFALEVLSPNDRSREKFDFYAAIGTREVMMIDRDPWSMELYRLDERRMELVAKLVPDDGAAVVSLIAPLQFSMHARPTRPIIKIVHITTGEQWEG